jgi:heptosyltransferase-2
MATMNVPLPSTEPDLQLSTIVLTTVGEKFTQFPHPWAAIGIGASHPEKDWPDNSWREFLRGLQTPGTVFLVGGPANEARAEQFVAASGSGQIVNACALPLIEAAALLRLADLFVGPSSGPLNLAAAGGTDAYGLVRLDTGFDLLKIHPRHRAGGRPLLGRLDADCTGAGSRADRALAIAAKNAAEEVRQ